jgi:fido (protein-threonine AMPylation protein)
MKRTQLDTSLSPLSLETLRLLEPQKLSAETLNLVERVESICAQLSAPTSEMVEHLSFQRLQASTTLVKEITAPKQEALNNWAAANEELRQFIVEQTAIDGAAILSLHTKLNPASFGLLRTTDLQGGNCTYPPAKDLAVLWSIFESEVLATLDTEHPILEAAKLYQWLITLHFFADANGRTARLLADWRLAQAGFPPLAFPNDASSFVSALDVGRGHTPELAVRRICQGISETLKLFKV